MLDKETYYLKKMKLLMLNTFNMVQKVEEAALSESANSQNLSPAEMHTLVAIGRHKPKTMGQIASELLINVSTLSIAIKKLEAKGCVKRIKDKNDKRIVNITLSKKGRIALDAHEQFYFNLVEEASSSMNEEEKRLFIQSLENMSSFFESKLRQGESEN